MEWIKRVSSCVPLFVCRAKSNQQRKDKVIILVSAQRNLGHGAVPLWVDWVSMGGSSRTQHPAARPIAWPLDWVTSLLTAVSNLSWMCLCAPSRVSLQHSVSFMASLGCAPWSIFHNYFWFIYKGIRWRGCTAEQGLYSVTWWVSPSPVFLCNLRWCHLSCIKMPVM